MSYYPLLQEAEALVCRSRLLIVHILHLQIKSAEHNMTC